jgi:hypothetical protein
MLGTTMGSQLYLMVGMGLVQRFQGFGSGPECAIQSTGRDLIPPMLYSKGMKRISTGVLHSFDRDLVVFSAALFQILGRHVSKLPFVITSPGS